jgi:broad specificity phosphatase PhoE
MSLYIRHSTKKYDNGKYHERSFDPGLTDEGALQAYEHFVWLLGTGSPVPEKIVCSPYLRARQTAKEAQAAIYNTTGLYIPIIREPRLREYINPKHRIRWTEEYFYPETLEHTYDIKHVSEQWHQLLKRADEQVAAHEDNTWYVSHGVVIQQIAARFGARAVNLSYPDILGTYRVDHESITPLHGVTYSTTNVEKDMERDVEHAV